MENPIKMDDLGGFYHPCFLETPIYIIYISIRIFLDLNSNFLSRHPICWAKEKQQKDLSAMELGQAQPLNRMEDATVDFRNCLTIIDHRWPWLTMVDHSRVYLTIFFDSVLIK